MLEVSKMQSEACGIHLDHQDYHIIGFSLSKDRSIFMSASILSSVSVSPPVLDPNMVATLWSSFG